MYKDWNVLSKLNLIYIWDLFYKIIVNSKKYHSKTRNADLVRNLWVMHLHSLLNQPRVK